MLLRVACFISLLFFLKAVKGQDEMPDIPEEYKQLYEQYQNEGKKDEKKDEEAKKEEKNDGEDAMKDQKDDNETTKKDDEKTTAPTTTPTTTIPTTTKPTTTTTTTTTTTSTKPTTTTNAHLNPSINPPINQWCPTNSGVNDKIRKQALEAHNWRRSMLALGRVPRRNGRTMPQAANMMQLEYDCALEVSARDRAQSCIIARNTDSKIQQNLFVLRKADAVNRPDAMRQAVIAWWRPVRTSDPIGNRVTFNSKHESTAVSSFTRMAWATTTKIGCAVRSCGQNWHVVCHYSPAGNVIGSQIYTPGTPCSLCTTAKRNVSLGLCVA